MQSKATYPARIDVEARLDQIAKRLTKVRAGGINVLNVIGASARRPESTNYRRPIRCAKS